MKAKTIHALSNVISSILEGIDQNRAFTYEDVKNLSLAVIALTALWKAGKDGMTWFIDSSKIDAQQSTPRPTA